MKNFLLTALIGYLLLCSNLAAAQKLADAPVRHCGTVGPTKEYLAAHPDVKARMEASEARTQQYIKSASALASKEAPGTQARPLVVIPVVVHIVYGNTVQNLSEAVVQEQIESLNTDFRKLNADVAQVPGVFAPLVADTRVSFCLATRDPSGTPTNGITRRSTSAGPFSSVSDENKVKSFATGGTDAWDTSQRSILTSGAVS